MDNAKIHHGQEILDLVEEFGTPVVSKLTSVSHSSSLACCTVWVLGTRLEAGFFIWAADKMLST
jgi:hypothetical protein